MVMATKQTSFPILSPALAVKAMRDNGYKNAAYAIAELVDNAVQAGAKVVEILAQEEDDMVQTRRRFRLKQLAIMDDGHGMDADKLRMALQFGNGERLNDRSGIGRFGMGLPNSSISQAKRVDVWTWQAGHAKAIYSYLDMREIEQGELTQVPEPKNVKPPAIWIDRSVTAPQSKSGTLVVWSELDKCDWKTARSIFKNSEYVIGRIYRYFIGKGKLRLRMADFVDAKTEATTDNDLVANDPLYLTPNSQLPSPWDKQPMFDIYGVPTPIPCTISGVEHTVTVKYSVAKNEARGVNAGDEVHGKHAKNNVGVSVVRADRELELQTGWCNAFDTRERWWGIEVNFPPALDEIFGVTNNKQSARTLAEYSTIDLDLVAEREGFSSQQELHAEWSKDNDLRLVLVEVKKAIESNLGFIRQAIKAQATRRDKPERHPTFGDQAEIDGTKGTKVRQGEGHKGTSDLGEKQSNEAKLAQITKDLEADGLSREEAQERAEQWIRRELKYEFSEVAIDTGELFTVRPSGGKLLIGLNTTHPAYDNFVSLLNPNPVEENVVSDIASLTDRLAKSFEGLKLLLYSWARYEDEQTDGVKKQRAQEARQDWGRVARQFFQKD